MSRTKPPKHFSARSERSCPARALPLCWILPVPTRPSWLSHLGPSRAHRGWVTSPQVELGRFGYAVPVNDQKDNKAESDTEADPKVAGSRPDKHGEGDGSYVGVSGSDDDFGAGEDGAEARTFGK